MVGYLLAIIIIIVIIVIIIIIITIIIIIQSGLFLTHILLTFDVGIKLIRVHTVSELANTVLSLLLLQVTFFSFYCVYRAMDSRTTNELALFYREVSSSPHG